MPHDALVTTVIATDNEVVRDLHIHSRVVMHGTIVRGERHPVHTKAVPDRALPQILLIVVVTLADTLF